MKQSASTSYQTVDFYERWSSMISRNPTITLEFIEKNINKPWNWGKKGLSNNPNITPDFIEKFIEKPWEWGKKGLSRNSKYNSRIY